jgi:hypothetical protein
MPLISSTRRTIGVVPIWSRSTFSFCRAIGLEDVIDERRVDESRLADVDHDELVLDDEQPEQPVDLFPRRHVVLAGAFDDGRSRRRVEHLDIGSGVHPSLRGVVIAASDHDASTSTPVTASDRKRLLPRARPCRGGQ